MTGTFPEVLKQGRSAMPPKQCAGRPLQGTRPKLSAYFKQFQRTKRLNMRAHVPRWRRGLQNRVWWVQFPTVRAIGVTSCLAAARSVSLRKWSFLCAVRKRQDEVIYVLAGTGFVKMNGCDRRTGAGLKSSVVGLGTTVFERNPRRGCGVVAVVLGQSRCVG